MNKIEKLLEDLAACLCRQITEDESLEPCFCGVIPGDMAVANYGSNCDDLNGMAWVRLAGMYPASGVGEQDISVGNCGSTLGFTIEMGILRQIEAPESDGSPPTPGQLLGTSDQVTTDALTMFKAIKCCPALSGRDFILGDWVPAGPMGLIVGGVWTLSVAL